MDGLKVLQESIVNAVETLQDSVVSINSLKISRDLRYGLSPTKGSGSGFIATTDGYVITNNHVIEGAENVEVVLNSGESFEGEVVGSDPQTDIAVVKIDAEGLKPAKMGDSDNLKVGQLVFAVGNALALPGGPTVSMGVIGAKNRPMPWADFIFEGLIQTDAAINPGNSGGPLADIDGNVIGVNTAMIPFAQGMGFSIPVNTVKRVMGDIISDGYVKRPWLGISGVDLGRSDHKMNRSSIKKGVLLVRVDQWSPAYEAGLRPGDIITKMGDAEITDMRTLIEKLSSAQLGSNLDIVFSRNGRKYKTYVDIREAKEKGTIVRIQ
ncbi:trypsin-like peptidase domain-containing protein [Oxyplasma meridianum]|uniref:Trypsin-like peptidase domain-containing protein n=1 Tax=Oxyplasma meridianum TaxID=3073602 RepID=A0AAX4NEK6_9ARCH